MLIKNPEHSEHSDWLPSRLLVNNYSHDSGRYSMSRDLTIGLNKIIVHMYVSMMNINFVSSTTKKFYEYYRDVLKKGQSKRSVRRRSDVNRGSPFHNERHQRPSSQRSQHPYGAQTNSENISDMLDIGLDLGLSVKEREDWLKRAGGGEDGLDLPNKSNMVFGISMFVAAFASFRFLLALFTLSPFVAHDLSITTTLKLTDRYNMLACANSVQARAKNTSVLVATSRVQQAGQSCDITIDSVQRFFENRFEGICIWNTSLGLGPSVNSFFYEQNHSIQMSRRESAAVVYIGAIVILGVCVVHPIIASRRLFDGPVINLIYKPRFVAFRIHYYLNNYLDLLRISYVHFWSIYTISPTDRLAFIDGRDTSETLGLRNVDPLVHGSTSNTMMIRHQGAGAASSVIQAKYPMVDNASVEAADSVHLSYKHYANYLPQARNSTWRSMLIVMHPLLLLVFLISAAIGFSITVLTVVFMTCDLSDANLLLHRAINTPESASSIYLPLGPQCLTTEANQTIAHQRFKTLLTDHIGDLLNNTQIRMKSAKIGDRDKMKISLAIKNEVDQSGGLRNFLANSIHPLVNPLSLNALLPFLSLVISVAFTAGSLTIFAITFLDLGFWLYELSIKLSICTIILRHYQNENSPRGAYGFTSSERWTRIVGTGMLVSNLRHGHHFRPSIKKKVQSIGLDEPDILGIPDIPMSHEKNWINIKTEDIIKYIFTNYTQRGKICEMYANRVIESDLNESTLPRQASRKFLISTYLDFRLFQDEIDFCREIVRALVANFLLHTLNAALVACALPESTIKYTIIIGSMTMSNLVIYMPSSFRSLCTRLNGLIFSMLAASVGGDRLTRYMFTIWRKCLTDLSGPRSKLSFRLYSLTITHATALQVS